MKKAHKKDHQKPEIVCVHLLNDYSGSPLVFSQSVRALQSKGYKVDLYTSKYPGEGFLSNIEGVNYNLINYNWSKIKILTLMKLLYSQLMLFLRLLKYINTPAIIYVNTVLPFGAALAGKLLGKRVVYHLHETSIKPPFLKKALFGICNASAAEVIYVSAFLRDIQPLEKPKAVMIPNALSDSFVETSKDHMPVFSETFNVLMLASLKDYKGVPDFIFLAHQLPALHFELVLNSDQKSVDAYLSTQEIPDNLNVYASQNNVHPFYERAHLVLNLSHPDLWQETFGMTALEAMSYGIPVIVPPVGGIAELVTDDFNGFKIDVRDRSHLVDKIGKISKDKELYTSLSDNAKQEATKYAMADFKKCVEWAVYPQSQN